MKCSICHSDNFSTYLDNIYDDRYGCPDTFTLVRCSLCGHKQIQADFPLESLSKLYTEYYPRSTFDLEQYQSYRESSGFKAWLNGEYCSAFRWIPRNVCILDIGCGFGESLGYHLSRGCDVYGVEVDENIRRVAEKFGYKIQVGLFNASLYEPNFFDYVTMDQVIEHVTDPVQTLRDIAKVLKPGSTAILSTPNSNGWGVKVFGRRWINWHAPYHLQHFSVKSMQLAAKQAGMTLELVKSVTNSEWLYYQWIHLILFPPMSDPSPFWSPNGKRSFRQKLTLKILSLIHFTKVNHLITRLFDLLGIGDNYLFFLRKK